MIPSTSTPEIHQLDVVSVRQLLLDWWSENKADYPWRRRIPIWQAIAVEIMLQRTRAEQVMPVFREFRRRYRSANEFAKASCDELKELIRPLGLEWRTDGLYALAKVAGRNHGRFSSDASELQQLKGVGPYVAAAVSSLHAGRRAVIIDSNVVRLLCRLKDVEFDGETRRKYWLNNLADELTPDCPREYNYALLDLSMTVCTPRSPSCRTCPLSKMCFTGQKTIRTDEALEIVE